MPRCLIIDDSSVVRKVAGQILGSLGYTVAEAETGADGVALCSVLMPELIFLDWAMPGTPKLETIKGIRALTNERRPYIVYVVTDHDTMDIARALAAGADSYMMKPFDRGMILEKIDEISTATEAA